MVRIRIREQLSGLVAFTALLAVGVLAVVTWVNNYNLVLTLRSQRLALAADLKASAISQSLLILRNAATSVSTRVIVQNALRRYIERGNNTEDNWTNAIQDLEIAMSSSSGGFGGLKQLVIWDREMGNGSPYWVRNGTEVDGVLAGSPGYRPELANGTRVDIGPGLGGRLGLLNVTENDTTIFLPPSEINGGQSGLLGKTSTSTMLPAGVPLEDGFPIALYPNATQFPEIFSPKAIERLGCVVMGPLRINESFYLMSLTIPIINNTSNTEVLGFMTSIVSAQIILDIVKDTRGLGDTGRTLLVGPTNPNNCITGERHEMDHGIPQETNLDRTNFTYVFNPEGSNWEDHRTRHIADPSLVDAGFTKDLKDGGSKLESLSPDGDKVSVGYSRPNSSFVDWLLIVEMDQDEVYEPVVKLRAILLGTALGTCGFILLLVWPMAHFAVRPIDRLRRATEKSTRPPSYTPDSRRSSDSLAPEASVYDGDTTAIEEGRGWLRRWQKQIHKTITDTDDGSGDHHSENRRRRVFRIPGRVKEHHHFVTDELTDLTRTFNEMTEELVKQYENLEDKVAKRTKDLEESKKQAEAANQAKSLFIANITHELRTPLNGILGMCAVCMHEDDVNKIKKSLGIVFKSGELLLHLLTDLLTFSKNQYGHQISLDEREFRLIDVSTQIKAIFEKQAKDSKITLQVQMEPEAARNMVLWGDANRIIQIIINLVSNSLKFTPQHGEILVRIKNLGEYEVPPQTATNGPKRINSKTGSRDGSTTSKMRLASGTHVDRTDSSVPVVSISGSENNVKAVDGKSPDSYYNEKTALTEVLGKSSSTTATTVVESDRPGPKPVQPSTGTVPAPPTVPTAGTGEVPTSVQQNASAPMQVSAIDRLQKEFLLGERPTSPLNAKTLLFAFEVEDNGPGIPEHLQEKVFEPFVQGDLGLSRKYGGTGLGLSICKQIAQVLQGSIELRSIERVGTTFIVKIPIKFVKESAASTMSPNASARNSVSQLGQEDNESVMSQLSVHSHTSGNQSSNAGTYRKSNKPRLVGLSQPYFAPPLPTDTPTDEDSEFDLGSKENDDGKIRVLVAEDNRVNQEVVLKMLRLEDIYDVTVAQDGQEAINKVKEALAAEKRFDLVLMDIQMPNVDGLESTRRIRHMGYEAPIVALTAFAEESNVKECLEAGMDYFLAKPIRRPQLKHVLRTYCPTIREEEEEKEKERERERDRLKPSTIHEGQVAASPGADGTAASPPPPPPPLPTPAPMAGNENVNGGEAARTNGKAG